MHNFQINNTNSFGNLNTAGLIDQLQKAITPTEAVPLIQALATRKTNAAIDALIQTLHHHHPALAAAAIEALVQLTPDTVEPLITAFQVTKDHGAQAYIIQALAQIGDDRALEVLLDVVGVEVANHCQGNVRRVAARGLGKIGRMSDPQTRHQAVEKLTWALLNAADWALRYAAVISLQEIATTEAMSVLQQALTQELDKVVHLRIQTALES